MVAWTRDSGLPPSVFSRDPTLPLCLWISALVTQRRSSAEQGLAHVGRHGLRQSPKTRRATDTTRTQAMSLQSKGSSSISSSRENVSVPRAPPPGPHTWAACKMMPQGRRGLRPARQQPSSWADRQKIQPESHRCLFHRRGDPACPTCRPSVPSGGLAASERR